MLNPKQYCVVVDPVGADGRPQLGSRQLRNGPASFFLLPGEGRGGEGGEGMYFVQVCLPAGYVQHTWLVL